jgi:hypothetical protein
MEDIAKNWKAAVTRVKERPGFQNWNAEKLRLSSARLKSSVWALRSFHHCHHVRIGDFIDKPLDDDQLLKSLGHAPHDRVCIKLDSRQLGFETHCELSISSRLAELAFLPKIELHVPPGSLCPPIALPVLSPPNA